MMKKLCCAILALVLLAAHGSALGASSWYPSVKPGGNSLRLYDDNRKVAYIAVKYVYDSAMTATALSGFAKDGDNIYSIYSPDGSEELVSFVSGAKQFRTLAKGDAQGTLRPLLLSGQNQWVLQGSSKTAISQDDLKQIMDFFGFSFDNNNPVLDRHIEARAGDWVVIGAGGKDTYVARLGTSSMTVQY